LVALPLAEGYTATEAAQAYGAGLAQPVIQNQFNNANALLGTLNTLNSLGGASGGGTGTSGLGVSTGVGGTVGINVGL
jgi:hypothetical protein